MQNFFYQLFEPIRIKKGFFIFLIISTILMSVLGIISAINLVDASLTLDLTHIAYIKFLKSEIKFLTLTLMLLINLSIFYFATLFCSIKPFSFPMAVLLFLYFVYSQMVVLVSIILTYGFFNSLIFIILLLIFDLILFFIYILALTKLCTILSSNCTFCDIFCFDVLITFFIIIVLLFVFSLILLFIRNFVILLVY